VTWTAISQDGFDTGAQQVSNRRVQFIGYPDFVIENQPTDNAVTA